MEKLPLLVSFSMVMFLLLILPRIAKGARLPGVIGFLLAGLLLGPHGFGFLTQDGPVIGFFSSIGKLLLMFFVGFEIDLVEFNRAKHKSLLFGVLTFSFPLLAGFWVAHLLGYGVNASVLIGSLMASHTLLAFPIIQSLGIVNRDSVVITVGATLFTDIAAMLVLAVCLPIHMTGFSTESLLREIGQLIIFVPAVIFGVGWIAKMLFRFFGDSKVARLTIIFPIIAMAAQCAHWINLEDIIGAFLAGITVKRAIGKFESNECLEVISQTLFIPAFFLTTGFLIDVKAFGTTLIHYPLLAVGFLAGLIASKFAAAAITSLILRFRKNDFGLMWSLSIPQVAATLAAALVAYNSINSAGERLIDEPVLNSVLIIVITTSVLGPILTEYFGKRIPKTP